MRKISANFIYTCNDNILKNGIIVLDNNNTIVDIIDTKGKISEIAGLEYYNGAIVPGFVNAHSHIELAHMKGTIEKTEEGLPGFLKQIIAKRNFPENLQDQIQRAELEMRKGGVIAVGDISNTQDSFLVKQKSSMHFETFIELFTLSNKASQENFDNGLKNYKKLKELNLPGTLVPHAPYSVPEKLFELFKNFEPQERKIISIHNQETKSENEFFTSKSGKLKDTLAKIGFITEDIETQNKSSLQTHLKNLNPLDNILLIHNTFTSSDDIDYAENYSPNIFWVFCPMSNLYIENELPDLKTFLAKGVKTCLGTDSYASNTELSILSEMKTIVKYFPEIAFENIVKSASYNGAKALKIDNYAGQIKIGMKPGINLIENFDLQNTNLKQNSTLRVLA